MSRRKHAWKREGRTNNAHGARDERTGETTHRHALDAGRGLTPHTPLDVIDLEPQRRALPRLDRQDLLDRVPPPPA